MPNGRAGRKLTFPKARRITRADEFELVRKNGRVERGRLLTLSILKTNQSRQFRAGLITSRAIGRAVARNRVRRRLREIVRRHQHEITDEIWIVTIARQPAANATSAELEAEWLRLAGRASILTA